MIMAVKECADTIVHHQLMYRIISPAGSFCIKSPGRAVCIISAPLEHVGRPCSPPYIGLRTSDHMMGKNKLKSGITVFQGLPEPIELLLPQRPGPPVVGRAAFIIGFSRTGGVRYFHRVLERIQDNEQCITPLPGIIVFTKMIICNRCQSIIVSSIESVRNRGGVVKFSGIYT